MFAKYLFTYNLNDEQIQIIINTAALKAYKYQVIVAFGCFFFKVPLKDCIEKKINHILYSPSIQKFMLEHQHINSAFNLTCKEPYFYLTGYKKYIFDIPTVDKRIEYMKRILTNKLKLLAPAIIDRCMKALNITNVTYTLSFNTTINIYGRIKYPSTYSKKGKSFTPEEITGNKYNIVLNWMLGAFNVRIFESVIIHEVVHMLELNHGKNFYKYVYSLCPNYDYYQKCLENGWARGENGELV